jgi:hypothetical protein
MIRCTETRASWTVAEGRVSPRSRFFDGCYDTYCCLPRYIFCGWHLLAAKLRPANIDAAAGAPEEAARIVTRIRTSWPTTRIILRADSGFCREALMAWEETNDVGYPAFLTDRWCIGAPDR